MALNEIVNEVVMNLELFEMLDNMENSVIEALQNL